MLAVTPAPLSASPGRYNFVLGGVGSWCGRWAGEARPAPYGCPALCHPRPGSRPPGGHRGHPGAWADCQGEFSTCLPLPPALWSGARPGEGRAPRAAGGSAEVAWVAHSEQPPAPGSMPASSVSLSLSEGQELSWLWVMTPPPQTSRPLPWASGTLRHKRATNRTKVTEGKVAKSGLRLTAECP